MEQFEEKLIEDVAQWVRDWLRCLAGTDFIINLRHLLPDLGYEKHASPGPDSDTGLSPSEETLIKGIADFVARRLWLAAKDFANRYIVARRDSIVRFGRRWQRRLSIPQYLHVVADANPGIRSKDIRVAAKDLISAGLLFTVGLVATIATPPDGGISGIAMALLSAVILRAFSVLGVWLALAHSQRCLMKKEVLRGVAAAERWAAPSCNRVGPRRLQAYL